jgi:hypothetical protein
MELVIIRLMNQNIPNMQFAWKSIRDRVNLLVKMHTKKLAESAGASGVCESYSVKVKLLEEVMDLKEARAGEKDLQKEAKKRAGGTW